MLCKHTPQGVFIIIQGFFFRAAKNEGHFFIHWSYRVRRILSTGKAKSFPRLPSVSGLLSNQWVCGYNLHPMSCNERKMRKNSTLRVLILVMVGFMITGCSLNPPDAVPTVEIPTLTVAPTETQLPVPSFTPTEQIAYAAVVNGEGIRLTGYEASLLQLEQAIADYPELFADELRPPQEMVLEALIDRALLAQAARAAGYLADQSIVAARLAQLTNQAGGEEAFNAWLQRSGYTLDSFLLELPLELEAAWQRDQVAAGVPDRMEQVRGRQILFYDPFQAARAYDQLQAGVAFGSVLENNDPNDLGYLDWFPRGVLLIPELEEILFSLSPGQYSEVIETDIGYHILYVIEKDPEHLLSSEMRLILEEQAVAGWLVQQRAQASIQILLP